MNRRSWFLLLIGVALAGCTSTTVDPLKSGVQVSFSTRAPAASASPPVSFRTAFLAADGDTISDGTNTLIIDKAQLVLGKVELEATAGSTCSSTSSDCHEIQAGPVLVDLPLAPGAQPAFAVDVPAGTYHQITFEVHKVSDSDPTEQAFRQAHPELVGKSVLVQGRFNGVSFTYLGEVDVEQELEMSPPLSVTAATTVNLTIRVSVLNWFRTSTGGLLDPATANKGGPNESRVNDNIKNSMKAFEDRDRDGDEHDG